MTDRIFLDSNVWVYALSGQGDKREAIARNFIQGAISESELVISYQVVNETIRILKKIGKREPELRHIIDAIFDTCEVTGFSRESAALASELREAFSVSYWDSHIVASAIISGCVSLVSEDLQDGARIRGVVVRNIFKDFELFQKPEV
jgi:predicted nucleic acid-binding protein